MPVPRATESRLKIVLIGGGSVAWTPGIVRDMLLMPALSKSEFVLLDIDRQAGDTMAGFLGRLNQHLGTDGRFAATTDRRKALSGADFVLITISTGGLKSMADDLRIPEDFGIFHTVGDTVGPGGWARFLRNFDVFAGIARDCNRYAPKAVVLNYSNPMSTLTDVLCRICKAPVIGLCHGLFENVAFLKQFYKISQPGELSLKYAGLNHFFWVTQARAGSTDVIADLQRRMRTRNLSQLLRDVYPDPMGFKSNRYVADELFRLTGVMPYFGDRHTCECFPHFITNLKNLEKYKLRRTPIAERRKMFADRRKFVGEIVSGRGEWPANFKNKSRETAADIILARSQNQVFIDVGNVPNIGQITNLPHGLVVETAVRVDGNGFTPLTFGPMPEMVRAFLDPHATMFQMLVDAAFEGNLDKSLQALHLDPTCSHLNGEQVDRLGRRLLKAHSRFISAF